jgi:hypothetical protein
MTVKEFAREQGYDDAISLGKWRGFDAYEPVFDGDVAYVGPPLMILVKGETIRMSTPEEGYQQIDGK